jgi:hypothetical protein
MDRRAIAALALGLAACSERTDSCFAGTTLISTPRGRRRMRELAVGDEVWSYDPTEKRFAIGTVSAIHRSRGEVRSVRTARGAIGAATATHPLFIASREAFAADVKVGETLLAWDDSPDTQPVAAPVLELVAVAPGDTIEVFNLTVAGANPTYFADGFFVHNKSRELTCDDMMSSARISITNPQLCVGESTALTIESDAVRAGCTTDAAFQKRVVLSTSDAKVLGIEGRNAVGRGIGTATVTVVLEGRTAAEVSIDVHACSGFDAGADASADTFTPDADAGD